MGEKEGLDKIVSRLKPLFINIHKTSHAKSEIYAASDDNTLRNYLINKRKDEKAYWNKIKNVRFGYNAT